MLLSSVYVLTQHASFNGRVAFRGILMQTNIDVDAVMHKISLSPQCSRPEGVELTHSCAPPAAASTRRPARQTRDDRPSKINAWLYGRG